MKLKWPRPSSPYFPYSWVHRILTEAQDRLVDFETSWVKVELYISMLLSHICQGATFLWLTLSSCVIFCVVILFFVVRDTSRTTFISQLSFSQLQRDYILFTTILKILFFQNALLSFWPVGPDIRRLGSDSELRP